jgi:Cys-rich four helix bundle protein (predicted Tat secretion target)
LQQEEAMQRREFIAAVATAAVAGAAAQPTAARAPATPIGTEVPKKPTMLGGKYAELEAAAGACLDAGEDCLRYCFGLLADKDSRMIAVAEATYELIVASRAVRSLAAVNSAHVPIYAKALEQTCVASLRECEKFPGIEECTKLGKACARCAAACSWTT